MKVIMIGSVFLFSLIVPFKSAPALTVTSKGFYSQTANAQLRNEFMLQMQDIRNDFTLQMQELRDEASKLSAQVTTLQSELQAANQGIATLQDEVRWLRDRLNAVTATSPAPPTNSAISSATSSAVAPAAEAPSPMCNPTTFPNMSPHLGRCRVGAASHGEAQGYCEHSQGSCVYRCVSGTWVREVHGCFDPGINFGGQ